MVFSAIQFIGRLALSQNRERHATATERADQVTREELCALFRAELMRGPLS